MTTSKGTEGGILGPCEPRLRPERKRNPPRKTPPPCSISPMHIHTHTHTYPYTHAYIHTPTPPYTYIPIYIHIHPHTHISPYTRTSIYTPFPHTHTHTALWGGLCPQHSQCHPHTPNKAPGSFPGCSPVDPLRPGLAPTAV